MEEITLNIDDIMKEVNKLHITTLQHAAEISPLVTGRTIGPDLEVKSPEMKKEDKNAINRRKTPVKENEQAKEKLKVSPPPVEYSKEPSSLMNLDYQTINCSILLREAEQQRKRSIRQQVLDMQEKHLQIMREAMEPIEKQAQQERKQYLEKKRRSDSQILKQAAEQTALELKEHEQQLQTLRKQTQRHIQIISFQGVSQYQTKFRSKYEAIVNLLMSIDKQSLISCVEYNDKLKQLIQMFEQLIGKIKSGECGTTELKTAENLCKSLETLEANILDACKQEKEKQEQQIREQQRLDEKEAAEARKLAEQKEISQTDSTAAAVAAHPQPQAQPQQQQQQQSLQASLAQQPTQTAETAAKSNETVAATAPNTTTTNDTSLSSQFVSQERFAFYTKINTFYQEKVERVKVLQTDETMKKYRFDCQKSINIPVNSISAVNQQHMQDKFDKLLNFVNNQPALGRDYCILLMAKKFVGQGETTISSNPQAAFPVASVIVSLWKHIPEFGQLFLAYVFKECPFLVPYFVPHNRGQTLEEYSKLLGYRSADGQLEPQDMYLKRQSGIARLYAAVMITNGRAADGNMHPYGLDNAWLWLANFVLLAPMPDICATLMMEILQIVGQDLWTTFGKQFVKLLFYIQQQYFPKLSAVDEGGPKARLELLLNNFLRDGQIPKPTGMLPPGFW